MTARRKIAPTMPEIQIADSTPRGAWRLASRVSSPNVPAVSKPYTTNRVMNMPTRKIGQEAAVREVRVAAVSMRTDSDWWFAKNSRISAKTSIPRISAPTPMLLMIASSRTPKALMRVVVIERGDRAR